MKILIVPTSVDGYLKNSASERFRCDWLLPYLEGGVKYGGADRHLVTAGYYDVIIFQKAYLQDWVQKMATEAKGLKIFDITDPEWLFRPEMLKMMLKKMDVIIASTEALAHDLRNIVDKPVYVIPDRHELSFYKRHKVHEEAEKPTLIWFGYAANFNRLSHLILYIINKEYRLINICDKPVPFGEFVEWSLESVNDNILRGDIVLNPPDLYGYKSNNKTVSSWLLGMPVAETVEDIERFCDYDERVKESQERLKEAQENYNISLSANQLIEIINKHKKV